MGRKHFKVPGKHSGPHFTAPQPINYDEAKIIFSLEKVVDSDYCFSQLDKEHKAAFAESVFKRRLFTWGELKQISRHGLGFERISESSILTAIPPGIRDDVGDNFIAFRYHGKNPMIGYREKKCVLCTLV